MGMVVKVIDCEIGENTCFVSHNVAKEFSLTDGKKYHLKFGQCKAQVKIRILNNGRDEVQLNSMIFSHLGIPEHLTTCMTMAEGGIALGPVLGIFVNPDYLGDLVKQHYRPTSMNMVRANEDQHAFVYFFSIGAVNWFDKKMEGCYYSFHQNHWVKKWLPLPDVVYDRGVGFYSREKLLVEHFRDQFSPVGNITRINARDCLDKYWLFERLKRNINVRQYLPDTIRYKSINDLIEMSKKYKTLYLKSFYGNRGNEVMAVVTLAENSFECSFFSLGKPKQTRVNDVEALSEQIGNFFKDKKFIVQQGIELIQHEGSNTDMRILVQKDKNGRWASVYIVAIKGRRGSLITAGDDKGARFYDFIDLLPLALDISIRKARSLEKQMIDAAICIAGAIENEYGPFGEIGMDMALDKNQKIWFIEANSKPDRELEPGDKGNKRGVLSCWYTIQYAKYLSGFNRRDNKIGGG